MKNFRFANIHLPNSPPRLTPCGECGAYFGRKVWHSTDKYKTEIYRYNHKYKGKCDTGHITEDEIKSKFVEAYNKMYHHKKSLLEDAEIIKTKIASTEKDIKERDKLKKQLDIIYKKSEDLIQRNTTKKQDQEKYKADYNKLVEESNKLNERLQALENKINDKISRVKLLEEYINTLKTCKNTMDSFDDGLFASLVDNKHRGCLERRR